MNDFATPAISPVGDGPGLTQGQRLIYVFTAPSKTFQDIKRSTSWWLPFIITAIFGYALFFGIQTKVGWEQVAENNIKSNPRQAEQMEKAPPEQRATSMKFAVLITKGIFIAMPVLSLVIVAVTSGVLLLTINFGFGGKASFWEVFAVSWYAGLPGLIKFLLGTVALFAGLAPESFNTQNFGGTNIGYYLPPDTAKPLMSLATSLDVVTIWSLALTAIGLSIVAGTKRSSGYIAVFAWWAIIVLGSVGFAAAF